MAEHRVRVISIDVGGGFGAKSSVYPEEVTVCALARILGRPVKWTSDRREDLMATSQAWDEVIDAELTVKRDGTIVELKAEVLADVGAYSVYPWTAGIEPVQTVSFSPDRITCRTIGLAPARLRRARPRPVRIEVSAVRSRPS